MSSFSPLSQMVSQVLWDKTKLCLSFWPYGSRATESPTWCSGVWLDSPALPSASGGVSLHHLPCCTLRRMRTAVACSCTSWFASCPAVSWRKRGCRVAVWDGGAPARLKHRHSAISSPSILASPASLFSSSAQPASCWAELPGAHARGTLVPGPAFSQGWVFCLFGFVFFKQVSPSDSFNSGARLESLPTPAYLCCPRQR